MRTLPLLLSVLLASSALAQDAATAAPGEVAAPGETATPAASPGASSGSGLLVAPKLGYFDGVSRLGGSLFAGLEVGMALPVAEQRLAVLLEGVWFQPRQTGTIYDAQLGRGGPGAADFHLRQREVGVSVMLAFFARNLVPVEGLTPYAALGAGAYFQDSKAGAFGETFTETGTAFGFNAQLGAQYAMGPGALFVELGYRGVGVDLTLTGAANAGGWVLPAVGYRMGF